mgnify:FL=1
MVIIIQYLIENGQIIEAMKFHWLGQGHTNLYKTVKSSINMYYILYWHQFVTGEMQPWGSCISMSYRMRWDETPLIAGPVCFQQVIKQEFVMQQSIFFGFCAMILCIGLINPGGKVTLWYVRTHIRTLTSTQTHTDIQMHTHSQTRKITNTHMCLPM